MRNYDESESSIEQLIQAARPVSPRRGGSGLSHSQIEKRRRAKIAEAMSQLQQLVPRSRRDNTRQKLHVLSNAVEHMMELQEEIRQLQQGRGVQMEREDAGPVSPISPSSSSGQERGKNPMDLSYMM